MLRLGNPPLGSNTNDPDEDEEEYCDKCGRHVDDCRCGFEDVE